MRSANSNATPSSRGFYTGLDYIETGGLVEYDSGLGDLKVAADAEQLPFTDSNGTAVGNLADGAAYLTGSDWSAVGADIHANEALWHFA
jgi:hypothetical protein